MQSSELHFVLELFTSDLKEHLNDKQYLSLKQFTDSLSQKIVFQ